jgi:glycosyltransferase involved in cell wall biosynthesis
LKPISIAFFTPYPKERAPSQRFRIEMFIDRLEEKNIHWKLFPFIGPKQYDQFYNSSFNRLWITLLGFLRRWIHLYQSRKVDYICIHREASPVGPPIFEFILSKWLHKKIIFDFDDAIWLEDPSEKGTIKSWVKQKGKFSFIIRNSYKVSAGNEYLATFARNFNSHVVQLPTVVDTVERHNPFLYRKTKNDTPVIGWTGSHTTIPYLESILPVLRRLNQNINFKFLVISNKPPDIKDDFFSFQPWNKESEAADLLQFDIGIMPLHDDEWSKGKCGFKLIQYLSMGIPAVASRVGENVNIIQHGKTGFLCEDKAAWALHLRHLLENPEIRIEMGERGRAFIQNHYSKRSVEAPFINLFR